MCKSLIKSLSPYRDMKVVDQETNHWCWCGQDCREGCVGQAPRGPLGFLNLTIMTFLLFHYQIDIT